MGKFLWQQYQLLREGSFLLLKGWCVIRYRPLLQQRRGRQGLLAGKVSFFPGEGKRLGSIRTKHSVLAVFESVDELRVETGQQRVVVLLNKQGYDYLYDE